MTTCPCSRSNEDSGPPATAIAACGNGVLQLASDAASGELAGPETRLPLAASVIGDVASSVQLQSGASGPPQAGESPVSSTGCQAASGER